MWNFLLIFSYSLLYSTEISKDGGGQYVFNKLSVFSKLIFHGISQSSLKYMHILGISIFGISKFGVHFSTDNENCFCRNNENYHAKLMESLFCINPYSSHPSLC